MGEVPGVIWMRAERPARGRQPAYSRERITAAAMKIADAEGIERITMRRIAAEIDAGTMSIYRYVVNKDDLIELMIDAAIGEYDLPERPSGDWREDLRAAAHQGRALMMRHPWLTRMPQRRLSLGPNSLKVTEYNLACVDGLGMEIDEMLSVIGMVRSYVDGFARDELAEVEENRRSGLTEEQWRMRQGPYVQRIIDSGKFPLVARVIIEARQPHMDPDERFAYGLERILDGIAASLPRVRR